MIDLIEAAQQPVDEGWKEKAAAATLAGAMATGAASANPPVDQAIRNATSVYNINKAVKKHKHKSEDDAWSKIEKRKATDAKGVSEESEKHECPHCHGSGRMVRDPDIGTDQECFVCDGTGYVDQIDEASPEAIARIHKLSQQ